MVIKFEKAELPNLTVVQAKEMAVTGSDYINSVVECNDRGYIVGGYFESRSIDLGNGISLTNKGSSGADGIIVKYNNIGEIEWAQGIGGGDGDFINSVTECSDGGCIAAGYFKSRNIDLGNGISLTNKGEQDGMLIKYKKNGEVEWAQGIGGIYTDNIYSVAESSDGGCIVAGYFKSCNIDLGNGVNITCKSSFNDNGIVIKYDSNGKAEWAQWTKGTSHSYLNAVEECDDGGFIVGGDSSSSSIDLGNGISLTKKGSEDGMVIKYSSSGEVEWARVYACKIDSLINCSDGGYLVSGNFWGTDIDLGNGVSLANKGRWDGMITKYSSDGEVEWAQGIGGSSDEEINSVVESSDGGYIVGGYFVSSRINLENGISLIKKEGS